MHSDTSQKKTSFEDILQSKKILLLDGGLSNQLEDQGMNLNNSMWSASILMNNPDAIVQAHLSYLNAGADCIITSSYQASEVGFKAIGIQGKQAQALIVKSVTLAEQAVDRYLSEQTPDTRRPLIAASIGPYGACQADGSEYHGNYGLTDDELSAFHLKRLSLLDSTNANILACETIPSRQEAFVLQRLLLSVRTPAWISFSCRDGQYMNDGSLVEDCVALFADHPNVKAIGVNCTAPQHINELILRIKNKAPNKAVVVYPNSGEQYNADTKTWAGTTSAEACGAAALSWIKSGATIIGGCCRMGPGHIKEMKRLIR